MKNFKKLSALLTVSVITAGTVSSLSAGARLYIESYDDLDNLLDDSFAVSRSDDGDNLFADGSACYWGYDDKSKFHDTTFILADKTQYFERIQVPPVSPNVILLEPADESSYNIVCDILKEKFPELDVTTYAHDNYLSLKGFLDKVPFEEARKTNIDLEKSREIYNTLIEKAELKVFEYRPQTVSVRPHEGSITEYSRNMDEETRNILKNYVSENLPDCHVEETYYDYASMGMNIPNEVEIKVVPNEDVSPEEHYAIANKIYKATNIAPYTNLCEFVENTGDEVIDLHNNIDGDANDDGTLSLADAITIMQSVGNPDKYSLTPQGEFNADIAGDYDGITNMDALAVQRKLLHLE